MKAIKATLICTVYNEEKSIKPLLDSILNQTRIPDEILILDSLSKDKTAKIIKSYRKKGVGLIEKKADIGTARNILVKRAKYDIILVTDGGSVLDKNWCEEMLKPFEDSEVKIVGGVYKPMSKNFFEKCQGEVVCKPIEKINEKRFIPSSRSLAFKKEVWRGIGGYPKHGIGGEDTRFVLNAIEKGYKSKINKKAIVFWRMRSPLSNFIRQFYLYAKGEVRAGNLSFPQLRPVLISSIIFPIYMFLTLFSFLAFRNIFFILLIIPFLYFFYQGIKVAFRVKDIMGIYWGFLLSFLKRFAYFTGIWSELLFPNSEKYRNENY